MRIFFFFIGAVFGLIPQNCIHDPVAIQDQKVITKNWDTSFTIDQAYFPDSSTLHTSILNEGSSERLSVFFNKIVSGNEVTVGYIGGSITAGAGASVPDNCYANRLIYFLRTMFQNARINIVNAGIGSTNTRFGCSRLKEDLLHKNPDLVIIEYAVNDNPFDTFTTTASMEGIVRQCLKVQNLPLIIFCTSNSIGDTSNQSFFWKVGNYYGVPMVSYRNVIWPLIQEKKLQWASLVADAIHPNDNGHLLCAYVLFKFLKHRFYSSDSLSAPPEIVPECRLTDLYEHAGIYHYYDVSIQERISSWQKTEKEYGRLEYASQTISDSLVLETNVQEFVLGFNYSSAGLSHIKISLDERTIDTVSNSWKDVQSGSYMGLYRVFIDSALQSHHVVITHLDTNSFYINYVLFASTSSCFKNFESTPFKALNF